MSTSRIDLILRQLDALPPLPAAVGRALDPRAGEKLDLARLRPLVDCLALASAEPQDDTDPRLEFWMHSLAVGCAAELLAEKVEGIQPSAAFVCGLLHDLGKLALHAVLPKGYSRVVAAADVTRTNIFDVERNVIGLDHHTAGKRLAERWRLPPAVREVIWLHNQALEALPPTPHAAMIALVTLADGLVRARRIGYSGNYSLGPPCEPLTEALGLANVDFEPLLAKAMERTGSRGKLLGIAGGGAKQLFRRALQRSSRELAQVQARLDSHENDGRARRRCFASLAELDDALHPSATIADVLTAIAQSAAEALDCGPVAGFAFCGETSAEMVLIESGRSVQRGHAEEAAETPSMRPVRPPTTGDGDGPARPAGDELEWVTSTYGPRLRGTLRWWLRLESDDRTIGGIVWGGGADELERLGPVLPELQGLCAGWSLALRAVQAREASVELAEQLARVNQRLSDLQEQLTQERAALSLAELAAGAAHEMNNPLMIISGRSQLLSRRLADPRDRHAAEVIHQNAGRVSDMITELMRFARPDPADRRPTAVEQLFTETMQLIADLPERADRQIEWSLPEVPAVHVDGHQVSRALAALVENGLQATPETTGRIEVHAAPDVTGEQVMITILDNGTGMDATTLRRAFDPFFSKKPAGRRRGMGLPVALRLIESNGGTLRLDSREGAGTRALILLPVAVLPVQAASQRLIA